MAKENAFAPGDNIPASFTNDQQEADGPSAWGMTLTAASSTTLTVVPVDDGSTTGQSGARFDGLPRYITAAVTLSLAGSSAGTYDVYAVLAGSISSAGFTLDAVAHGSTRPASSRLLGQVDWSGSAIMAIRNMVSAVSGHAGNHLVGGDDAMVGPWIPLDLAALTGGAWAYYTLGFVPAGRVVNGDTGELRGQLTNSGGAPCNGSHILDPSLWPAKIVNPVAVGLDAAGPPNFVFGWLQLNGFGFNYSPGNLPSNLMGRVVLDGLRYPLA